MRSRRRADALLWAALAVPALTVDRMGLNEPRPAWQQAAGIAVLGLAAAAWRRWPQAGFAAAAGLELAAAPSLFTLSYGTALAVFALLMGRKATRVRPALLLFGAIALLGTAKIVVRGVDPVVEWLVLMGTLLFGAVFPWLAGRYLRQGRELAAAGWARAGQLEREQRIVADRARLRERARIAQDMHDSLGHELSLIAVRAGALQVAADLPERHRGAAADLRVAASDATDRLHEIIGLLREEGDEVAPLAPAGESVRALVERAADSGLPVRYVAGDADEDRTRSPQTDEPPPKEELPPKAEPPPNDEPHRTEETDRTVHRIVQEALTNAAKHAPGASVTVEVRAATVVVTNGPAKEPGSGPGVGSGLVGLRARVEDLGGTLDAGPHGDGFRVVARLPAEGGEPLPVTPAAPTGPAYARRRTVLAFGAALATGVLLVGGAFAWYAYSRSHAVLEPADFARLTVGQAQADAVRILPDTDASDPPDERAPTPPPEGADCRYYRASGELFVTVEHFRVCFDGGILVEKSVIPKAGVGAGAVGEVREHV
ncbi:sensor histidine kinase [Streptomyces sp. NPDC058257]|uniref:sensor histidine kinase n=1 Tax=Streptomyces sp. NPDC058257 TaxID=3346409 RepID=UPI0036E63405